MTLATLLWELGRAGFTLSGNGHLIGAISDNELDPTLEAAIRHHRHEILVLLGVEPTLDGDAREHLDERLGMAEELGMRVAVGSPAWLIAMGEVLYRWPDVVPSIVKLVDTAASALGWRVRHVQARIDPITGEDTFERLRRDTHAAAEEEVDEPRVEEIPVALGSSGHAPTASEEQRRTQVRVDGQHGS